MSKLIARRHILPLRCRIKRCETHLGKQGKDNLNMPMISCAEVSGEVGIYGGVFMFLGFIFSILLGFFCIWLGYKVWFKEQITLLHSSRYTKVEEKNKKFFCRTSGFGIILIGIAFLACDIVFLITFSLWSLLIMIAGLAAGIAILVYSDRKYNR
ncbi:MAG: DUF3784 domain-containing protein [Clostridia bacterium]|nr:DUF3784 domain-containing protein [Clostridia bacterium]